MKKLPHLTDEQCDKMDALLNERASIDAAIQSVLDAAANRHSAINRAMKEWWDEVLGVENKNLRCAYVPRYRKLVHSKERAWYTAFRR